MQPSVCAIRGDTIAVKEKHDVYHEKAGAAGTGGNFLGRGLTVAGQDHAEFVKGPFKTGEQVTAVCLECHEKQAADFMKTAHWKWKGTPNHVQGMEKVRPSTARPTCSTPSAPRLKGVPMVWCMKPAENAMPVTVGPARISTSVTRGGSTAWCAMPAKATISGPPAAVRST